MSTPVPSHGAASKSTPRPSAAASALSPAAFANSPSPAAHHAAAAAAYKAKSSPYAKLAMSPSGTHSPQAAHTPSAMDSLLGAGMGRARMGHAGKVPAGFGGLAAAGGSSEAGTPMGLGLGGSSGPGTAGATTGGGVATGASTGGAGAGGAGGGAGSLSEAALMEAIGGAGGGRSAAVFAVRTREIAGMLARRWGRVSQESLVASVPRLGLDGMWEDGMGDRDVTFGRSRSYIIAGKGFSVEVEWRDGRVKGVVLDLPNAREEAKRSLGRAADILKRDLLGWEGQAGKGEYVELDKFAANLARLAAADQLGQEQASCFDALEGVYTAQKKIWDWELQKVKEKLGEKGSEWDAQLEVICHRSGRPTMHTDGKIGLKLDYWLDRHVAASGKPIKADATLKDQRFDAEDELYTLLIECQTNDPGQYPSIRITDNWISEEIGKEVEDETVGYPTSMISWSEPPILLIPTDGSSAEHDPMDIDAAIRQAQSNVQPHLRFSVRFEPPLVVPFNAAGEIFGMVNCPVGTDAQPLASLLFPDAHADEQTSSFSTLTEGLYRFRRTVHAYAQDGDGGAATATPHEYEYRIYAPASLLGLPLVELPFSHPSQLVSVLPMLRQWALFNKLLRRSVGLGAESAAHNHPPPPPAAAEAKRSARHPRLPVRRKPARPQTPPSDTDSELSSSEDERRSATAAKSGQRQPAPSSRRTQNRTSPPATPSSSPPASSPPAPAPAATTVDISISYSPVASRADLLCVSRPSAAASSSAAQASGDAALPGLAPAGGSGARQAWVSVLRNGRVEFSRGGDEADDGAAAAEAGAEEGEAAAVKKEEREEQEEMLRVLRVCEDLAVADVWVKEWVKRKAGGKGEVKEGKVEGKEGAAGEKTDGEKEGEKDEKSEVKKGDGDGDTEMS